jgi:hypothetical protein
MTLRALYYTVPCTASVEVLLVDCPLLLSLKQQYVCALLLQHQLVTITTHKHAGFAEENKLKDPVTARISADSSVFAAELVAASIVQGLADGTFMITTGLDGWLISQGTAGFAPAQSALQALANVLLAGILRAASFAYLFRYSV